MASLFFLLLLLLAPAHAQSACNGVAGQCVVQDLATATGAAASASGSALPVPDGSRVSSAYGWRTHPISGVRQFHSGTDFALSRGSNVLSPGDGTITYAAWAGGYGRFLEVTLTDGTVISYAHLLDFNRLQVGSKVKAGSVVGHVNSSGSSTGDHLHLEVQDRNGTRQDPVKWFGY
jgi:murein DD-endopeptidase MepM/ murein hydrolase activator NlpD